VINVNIVLDTNILVSGLLNPNGKPGRVADFSLAAIFGCSMMIAFWQNTKMCLPALKLILIPLQPRQSLANLMCKFIVEP
jgi:predicted nucleic acid-binding protein